MENSKISYMKELEMSLKELMVGLPNEKQAVLIEFVKARVYESYKNGKEASAKGVRTTRPERQYAKQ